MKLSEVLQAVRLLRRIGNHETRFQKYQPSVTEMNPGGITHHSPYGHHLILNPQYGHRGQIPGVASVTHVIRHGGSGTSASGVYGSQPEHGYHSTGYGGGHPAPAGYDYHPPVAAHAPIADATGPIHSMGCLKEHMDTMNPTVMVMTAGVSRSRVSKLADMNSREQQNTISQNLPQPVLTMNYRGESSGDASSSYENIHRTPFNDGGNTKIEYAYRPDPEPEYYPAYANRTMTQGDKNYEDRYHYPYRHYQRLTETLPSPSPSSSSSPSSFSSGSNSADSNYYSETMNPYYTRIN